jgi:hypothetical protein
VDKRESDPVHTAGPGMATGECSTTLWGRQQVGELRGLLADPRFSGSRVVDRDTIVIGERVSGITVRSIVGGNMPGDREWMERAGYAEKE